MANKKTSIGGQALIEGIMMRGPEKTSMAVRNAKKEIVLETEENSTKVPKICKLPIIRGVYGMISSMLLGYKCLMRSADISLADAEAEINAEKEQKTAESEIESESTAQIEGYAESESDCIKQDLEDAQKDIADTVKSESEKAPETEKVSKDSEKKNSSENKALLTLVMILGVVLGVGLAIFLFIFLPTLVSKLIIGGNAESLSSTQALLRSVIEGVMKIVILVLYMWAVSFMSDIKRTFMYHGAEHKTIFCYEKGLPLTVENVRAQRRFHPRCGTSFLILMLIVSIFIGFFIRIDNVLFRALIKFALLPITVGIGYELIKFAGRHDNIITRIISAPGVALQHITTKEPTDDMIECAIAAMNEVIPEDSEKDNW